MNWKTISWLVFTLAIFGVGFLWLMKAPIMSWYLSKEIKVPVSVSKIIMRPSFTKIHDFKIQNPRGFKLKNALEIDETTVTYRLKHLLGNPSEVDEIVCDGITLTVECSNLLCKQNNWTVLGEGIPKKEKKTRNVVIHKLILTNLTATVYGIGPNPVVKRLARLEFNEVDSDKGFPTEQLIQDVFGGMGLQQYVKDLFLKYSQKAMKKVLKPILGQTKANLSDQ